MVKGERYGEHRSKIRLVIIMDDERFYLADALRYFLARIPDEYEVAAAIALKYYYERWHRGQWTRARHIVTAFGLRVFMRVVWRLVVGQVRRSKSVATVVGDRGIPVLKGVEDVNAAETIQYLAQFNPDLIVAIGVNSLFRRRLRELARLGCINVHTGIRPEHRGQAAIFWALADGHTETGVTVHHIDGGVDSGRPITTSRYRITVRSFERLLRDLRMQSIDTLVEALSIMCNGQHQKKEEGQSAQAAFRPQPSLEDLKAFVKAGNRIF